VLGHSPKSATFFVRDGRILCPIAHLGTKKFEVVGECSEKSQNFTDYYKCVANYESNLPFLNIRRCCEEIGVGQLRGFRLPFQQATLSTHQQRVHHLLSLEIHFTMADSYLEEQICNLQAQLSAAHAKISLLEAEHKQTAQTPVRAISGNEMLRSLKLSAREGLSINEFKHFSNFLEMLETHRTIINPDLQTSVSKLLDDFSTAETIISQ